MANPWDPEIAVDPRARIAASEPDLAGEPITPLGEGWDNLAVRVGEGWVFRFARRELAARLMVREIAWAPRLARALPLPIAFPERYALPTPEQPFPYTGHRWLSGRTGCRADLDDAGRAALAEPLGAFLGALHALPVPEDAPLDILSRADHARRGRRAEERLAKLSVAELEDVSRLVARCGEIPAYDGPLRWVHGDLYGRHLLVDDGRLSAVIDWGDLHAGDPAIDLSIGWSFLPPSARGAFLAAYGRPVDDATWARARLVALDYAGALLPYGLDTGDEPAVQLGRLALRCALAEGHVPANAAG